MGWIREAKELHFSRAFEEHLLLVLRREELLGLQRLVDDDIASASRGHLDHMHRKRPRKEVLVVVIV